MTRDHARVRGRFPLSDGGKGETFIVLNCAFGDRIRQRAAAGDEEALRGLLTLERIDVPPRAQLAWRTAQIRLVAQDLYSVLANSSRHAVAQILAHAGRQIEQGRGLTTQPAFAALVPEERARLETSVRRIIDYGVGWPGVRSIENIL